MEQYFERFNEFQMGLLEACARELEGTVIMSQMQMSSIPVAYVFNRSFFPIVRWIKDGEPELWIGQEYLVLSDRNMTLNGLIRVIRSLKEDDYDV